MNDIRLKCIASGSSANAWLFKAWETRILIDAGASGCRILDAVEEFGPIDAIVVTHTHSDHIKGLAKVMETLKVPLLASLPTLKHLDLDGVELRTNKTHTLKDLDIRAFRVSHDADGTIGLRFSTTRFSMGFITDTGVFNSAMVKSCADVDTLVLESNHDAEMLMRGPYPQTLKRRIAGPKGHLSNAQALAFVNHVATPRLTNLVLAHLSETNNSPEVARATFAGLETTVHIATPDGGVDFSPEISNIQDSSERQLSLI